jgi:hypothetical protein
MRSLLLPLVVEVAGFAGSGTRSGVVGVGVDVFGDSQYQAAYFINRQAMSDDQQRRDS